MAPTNSPGWPQFGRYNSQQMQRSSISSEEPEFTLESLAAELTWLSTSPTATGGLTYLTGDFYSSKTTVYTSGGPPLQKSRSLPIVKKHEFPKSCVHTEKRVRRAKSVRFADTQGLPLVEAVHPLTSADPSYTENKIVPYSDEDFFGTVLTLSGSQKNHKNSSAPVNCKGVTEPKLPKPLRPHSHRHTFKFSQPGNDPRFFERLAKENVVLENIRAEPRSVHGIIRVSNIAYHKEVTVRWTHDAWRSSHDTHAVFCTNDGGTDRFTFEIPVNGDDVQFAIRYQTDGKEFWDNNRGQNYLIVSER